jgi:hypothetical protein
LLKSLVTFDSFSGAFKPHVAYGALDKSQLAAAHAMRLFNYLLEALANTRDEAIKRRVIYFAQSYNRVVTKIAWHETRAEDFV